MLINSVILLLRDALPVFLFIGMLNAILLNDEINHQWLTKALACGILGIFVVALFVGPLSELADGFGFEIMTAFMHLIAYAMVIVFLLVPPAKRQLPAIIATTMLMSIHGTNLYIYFSGYWSDLQAYKALLTGAALGLGISGSLALLLYYGLRSTLIGQWPILPLLVLALAAARQIGETAYFMVQADWLPATNPLWNTSDLLSDSSEYGHLLNALVGYEASPGLVQLALHIVALIIPVVIIVLPVARRHLIKEVGP